MDRRAHHRACVQRALSVWLEGDTLNEAIETWDAHFAHLPLFSLGEFARRNLPKLGVHIDADRLRDRVMGCLRDTREAFEDVSPPPAPALRNAASRPSAVQPESIPAQVEAVPSSIPQGGASRRQAANSMVFGALMETLIPALAECSDRARQTFRAEVLVLLERHAVGADSAATLAWLDGTGGQPYDIPWPMAAMQGLVHASYVHLCEALGPAQSDRLLTRAVLAAEALPEASAFPPRSLL